ncbi:hypothetical protein TB1_010816 [Malus domestica]
MQKWCLCPPRPYSNRIGTCARSATRDFREKQNLRRTELIANREMEGVMSVSDQQTLVSSFLEITVGQTADTARQFL